MSCGRGSSRCCQTDGGGIPLSVLLSAGNRNDVTALLPLIDAIPPVRGRRARPRRRPRHLYADRGYDHDTYRKALRAKGIRPHIARRGTPHGLRTRRRQIHLLRQLQRRRKQFRV
jgi:hypothetical protein